MVALVGFIYFYPLRINVHKQYIEFSVICKRSKDGQFAESVHKGVLFEYNSGEIPAI